LTVWSFGARFGTNLAADLARTDGWSKASGAAFPTVSGAWNGHRPSAIARVRRAVRTSERLPDPPLVAKHAGREQLVARQLAGAVQGAEQVQELAPNRRVGLKGEPRELGREVCGGAVDGQVEQVRLQAAVLFLLDSDVRVAAAIARGVAAVLDGHP